MIPPEKRDVGPGPDLDEQIGDGGGAREARIDVDEHGPPLLCGHGPVEADRVGFGHVRAHDEYAIAVHEIARLIRGGAETERSAQTGHGWTVSEPGLILDRDYSEAGREQLLVEVVFLVIERCAAECGHRLDVPHPLAGGVRLDEVAVATLLDQSGDAVHRPVERLFLPVIAVRGAVLDLRHAVRIADELKRVRPFRAKPPFVHRTLGIPLDIDDLSQLGEDELSAPDRTVGTDAVRHLRAPQPGMRRGGLED